MDGHNSNSISGFAGSDVMGQAIQAIRSVLFIAQMYLAMAVIAVGFLPLALLNKDMALRACHAFCRYVRWTASWMVGLRSEVRGVPPTGAVMIAAKHQSFFDIIIIFSAVPRGRFVMKKQLMRTPFLGWYAKLIDCVPVDRGKRGAAIRDMAKRVKAGLERPGQLIIYPQGTRVAPGVAAPYKMGTAVLYDQLQQDCVPVATNVGVFWPKRSMFRKPGVAVVEFLPPIPAGQDMRQFLVTLEKVVEEHSERLLVEAGFTPRS
jgi:1-acyl-sn-glycerol-3-phosphate acyltransferase